MEHHFDIDIAKEYGVLEAILINHFQFWIGRNKANNTNMYDGHYWTHNTRKAFQELFPYATEMQVYRAINNLVEKGVLVKGNFNQTQMDRTVWYAFNDEVIWLNSPIVQNCTMHCADLNNPLCKNEQPIPYNYPYNNQYTYTSKSACAQGIDKLKEYISNSDLREWGERKIYEYHSSKTLEDYIQEFYDNDFTVREKIERSARTEVLKHFQNWLPRYIQKQQEQLKQEDNGSKSREDSVRKVNDRFAIDRSYANI